MRYHITIIVLVLQSCSACDIDTKAKTLFDSQLVEFKKMNAYDSTEREVLIKIGNFFGRLTKHSPQFNYGLRFSYDNKKRAEDVASWQRWYDSNKCLLKFSQIDSVFRHQ